MPWCGVSELLLFVVVMIYSSKLTDKTLNRTIPLCELLAAYITSWSQSREVTQWLWAHLIAPRNSAIHAFPRIGYTVMYTSSDGLQITESQLAALLHSTAGSIATMTLCHPIDLNLAPFVFILVHSIISRTIQRHSYARPCHLAAGP